MPTPLTGFKLTDPFTTDLGWKVVIPQRIPGAHLYVNNQSDTEFALYGDGMAFLGYVPAWLTYATIRLADLYSYIEFRPGASLNVQGPPALYISAMFYEVGERLPEIQPIAVVRQTDIARQQRTVMVPMGLSHFTQGRWLDTDPATVVLQTALPSAAQLAAGRAPIYLYYANMVPEADLTGGMTFTLAVQWRDNANNPINTPFILARGGVIANNANLTLTPWSFAPVWPFCYGGGALGNIPGGATKADLQLTYQNGTRLKIDYSVGFWMDQSNTIPDGDIGTQALYNAANPSVNPYF